ncbi:integrin alpha-8-like isoform X2 [Glandiceps talaboti]
MPQEEILRKQSLPGAEYEAIDEKSHQWFGATLRSRKNGMIAACAPCRYLSFANDLEDRYLIGACYTASSDFSDFREYSPCKTYEWGISRVRFCQAGFSAEITQDKKHLVMGAVGGVYWQGQVYVQSSTSLQTLVTQEGPSTDDSNYLGYSVAVGDFTNDKSEDYIAGAPRSNQLKGLVKVFNSELQLQHELPGEQLGAYFGFSVCAEDVNGDGRDDIIVGAPFFTDRTGTTEKWEAGRVYIYYQDSNNMFGQPDRLTGIESKARFGSAITTLKDVDHDKYKDIAVGAPYGGKDGRGVVYIYNGSPDGIRQTPSQVIHASDIGHNLKTFGFSLSGGLDMDNNRYPDLLIGSYESDQAVLLKTRPVIDLILEIVTPEIIDLESKTCFQAKDNSRYACFIVERCFSYIGKHVPATIDIEYVISLDALKEYPKRAYFSATGKSDEKKQIRLFKKHVSKERICKSSSFVYLKGDVQDKYSPIAIDISAKLLEDSRRVAAGELSPILNAYISPVVRKQIHILNNCTDDDVCIPDLWLRAEMPNNIYIGSSETTTLEVLVVNQGDDAFEAEVFIWLPNGFDFIRVEQGNSEYAVGCVDVADAVNVVKCDCGNPLKSNSRVNFGLRLSASVIDTSATSVEIALVANSSNPELNATKINNNVTLHIPFKVKTSILFSGVSIPEQVKFKPRSTPDFIISQEDDIGPEIIQLYELRNLGPSAIDGAVIQIFWPAYTFRDDYLLYLLDVKLQGGLPCITDGLNPAGIKVDEDKLTFRVNLTDGIENYRRGRGRRGVADEIKELDVNCRSARCVRIECPIDFVLENGDSAFVQVRSRLWKDTLLKGEYDKTEITSEAHVQVTSMPYDILPDSYPKTDTEVTSIANTEKPLPRTLPVPLWVLAVSVAAGLLLLILVIIGLWKAGFFKRKRVEDKYRAQNSVNDQMSTFSGSPAFASLSTAESDVKSSRSNSNY